MRYLSVGVVKNMSNDIVGELDAVKEHATLLGATMVQVYKELKTLPNIRQVRTSDNKIVDCEIPDEVLIQAAIASVGMANKESRMVRHKNGYESEGVRSPAPVQSFKPADKLPPACAEDMGCPLCGEAVKTRESKKGKPYMYCDNKGAPSHGGASVFVNRDGTTKPMR